MLATADDAAAGVIEAVLADEPYVITHGDLDEAVDDPIGQADPGGRNVTRRVRGRTVFMMRFDMRAPGVRGADRASSTPAALEMASFAESRGAVAAVGVRAPHDGRRLPAVAAWCSRPRWRPARRSLPIMTAALILPLYDPIRLAEDMVVLDIISGGRVSYVMAVGYRPEEFEHHGADFARRGRLVEDQLALLLRAKSGEPFDYEGRRIHVTPAPVTPGGPTVMWGGGSPAAAKRAARFGLDFFAQGGGTELEEVYASEARAHGREPGFCMIPPTDMATTVFVADDLDAAWAELGPHLLHDVRSYAAINEGNTHTASLSHRHDDRRAARREPHPPHRHRRRSRLDDRGGVTVGAPAPRRWPRRPRSRGATSAPSPSRSCIIAELSSTGQRCRDRIADRVPRRADAPFRIASQFDQTGISRR